VMNVLLLQILVKQDKRILQQDQLKLLQKILKKALID